MADKATFNRKNRYRGIANNIPRFRQPEDQRYLPAGRQGAAPI